MNNSTIQEMIRLGKNKAFTTETLSYKTIVTDSIDRKFVVNMNNIFEKYYELLTDHTIRVELTHKEYLKYRYKPKLLSKDLYGTYDLYFLLLKVNYVTSVINFDFTELTVFKPEVVSLLNEIMILEDDNYVENLLEIIKGINE